ncbi:MAG: cytochrome c oxidase subunit II [Candidatus Limnocylindrales bacterium]
MRRAIVTSTRTILPLAALALAVSGCAQATADNPVPGFFGLPAITTQGQASQSLYVFILGIATVIFLLVEGLIIFAVLRYRRHKGDDELPTQTHGSMPFELAWTIVPFIIVVVLFVLSEQTQQIVDASVPNPPVTVDVTGFQWQWTFEYKDQGLSFTGQGQQGPVMVLPVGEDVHFRLHSNDVIHSFYLPAFFFKKDVVPGRTNEFDITLNQAGTYAGQCAEFCGLGHADMRFTVDAVSQADFATWVTQQQEAAKATPSPLPSGAQSLTLSASNTTAFDESTLTAPANQPFEVVFTNKGPAGGPPHDFAIKDPAGSGNLLFTGQPLAQPGQTVTYEVPALAPGTYTFICVVHPNMTGTLTVK